MLRSKKTSIIFIATVSLLFVSCSTYNSEESLLNDNIQPSNSNMTEIISTTENEETALIPIDEIGMQETEEATLNPEPKTEKMQRSLPFQLDEYEELDLSGLSNQALVLEIGEFYQDALFFDYFSPQQYGKHFLTDTEEVEQYKELYTKALERSQYYTDAEKATIEYSELIDKINNMTASYPTDDYVYMATMGNISYYREFMGMDIVIDEKMLEIVYRLKHYESDNKDAAIMEPKEFVWIAAVPRDCFLEEKYTNWE